MRSTKALRDYFALAESQPTSATLGNTELVVRGVLLRTNMILLFKVKQLMYQA